MHWGLSICLVSEIFLNRHKLYQGRLGWTSSWVFCMPELKLHTGLVPKSLASQAVPALPLYEQPACPDHLILHQRQRMGLVTERGYLVPLNSLKQRRSEQGQRGSKRKRLQELSKAETPNQKPLTEYIYIYIYMLWSYYLVQVWGFWKLLSGPSWVFGSYYLVQFCVFAYKNSGFKRFVLHTQLSFCGFLCPIIWQFSKHSLFQKKGAKIGFFNFQCFKFWKFSFLGFLKHYENRGFSNFFVWFCCWKGRKQAKIITGISGFWFFWSKNGRFVTHMCFSMLKLLFLKCF